jgi:hypothetical protein
VALVVGGVLWWMSRPSADGVASPPPHEPVPAERLNELEAALSSPDTAVQAEALDPAIFATLQASGQPLLPAGSTLEIDTDSSQIVEQTATVGATVVPGSRCASRPGASSACWPR